jgi:hypothetical protein
MDAVAAFYASNRQLTVHFLVFNYKMGGFMHPWDLSLLASAEGNYHTRCNMCVDLFTPKVLNAIFLDGKVYFRKWGEKVYFHRQWEVVSLIACENAHDVSFMQSNVAGMMRNRLLYI